MARRKKQNEDLPQENLDNSDDTFGLPEIEYEPLQRNDLEEPVVEKEVPEPRDESSFVPDEDRPVETPPLEEEEIKEEFVEENQFYEPSYSYSYQDEKPAIWPKVLGGLLILVVAGLAIWYFVDIRPNQIAEEVRERRELLAQQEVARKKEAERQAALRLAEEEKKKAAAVPVQPEAPPAGTIETLSSRSGRYYVVVASAIDGDLIMDYAKKLSSKGVTSTIIPPFGKTKFHRLAVANGDTYENAQATADGMKGGDYGDKVWVVKY
jgi:hypothetical protein